MNPISYRQTIANFTVFPSFCPHYCQHKNFIPLLSCFITWTFRKFSFPLGTEISRNICLNAFKIFNGKTILTGCLYGFGNLNSIQLLDKYVIWPSIVYKRFIDKENISKKKTHKYFDWICVIGKMDCIGLVNPVLAWCYFKTQIVVLIWK